MRLLGDRRVRLAVLAAIVLAALAFRAWGLTWGLHNATVERRPQPDEWTVYWLFRWFETNHNLNPCPQAATQCFFDWGAVYPYLAYAVHFLTTPLLAALPAHYFGPNAKPAFIQSEVAGRVCSLLASTVTATVVYRFGSVAYGYAAGLLAAILIAFSALLIELAHFATPDSTTSLLLSASLLALVLAMQRPTARRFAVTGVLIGLAMGTEYHMGLLALPLLAAWYLSPQRKGKLLAIAGAGAIGTFLLTNVYILVDLPGFVAAIKHTVLMRTVDSQAEYQGRWKAFDPAWLYVLRYPLGYGESAGLAIVLAVGVVWAVIRRRKTDLLLLCWVVPYFLLVSWSSAKFMRYSAPLLPALAVLAGAMLADLWSIRRVPRRILALATTAALLFALTYDAAYTGLFTSPDPRVVATAWLEQHVPTGTEVAFEELPDGLLNLPYFVTAAGYQPCIAQFKISQLQSVAPYIAVDNYDLEEHPRVPQSAVQTFRHALSDSNRFQVVERIDDVPTFLGLRFPIEATPNDWRYAAHTITVYRRVATASSTSSQCFPSLEAASSALHRASTAG